MFAKSDHGRALCIGKEEDDLDLVEGVHIWVEEGRQVGQILDLDKRASGLLVKRMSIKKSTKADCQWNETRWCPHSQREGVKYYL